MRNAVNLVLILLVGLGTGVTAASRNEDVHRLNRAAEVFNEIMQTPEKGIPDRLLEKASCIAVVPGLTKAGLGIGGKFGKGVVMCRNEGGAGWSAPGFITVEGGSVGLQIGVEKVDLVMLIMNRDGMNKLLGDKFTLGGDASVAAGPVGRDAAADTDIKMTAQILTYSRAKGVFAGLSLQGAVVKPDKDANRDFYGRGISMKEVLEGSMPIPEEARSLAAALSRQSARREQ
jgi:lipid-binding SYLF domain-containing protein